MQPRHVDQRQLAQIQHEPLDGTVERCREDLAETNVGRLVELSRQLDEVFFAHQASLRMRSLSEAGRFPRLASAPRLIITARSSSRWSCVTAAVRTGGRPDNH